MWFLISRRLRAWLLLTIALPVLRLLLHRASRMAAQRRPDGSLAGVLQTADRAASRFGRRKHR